MNTLSQRDGLSGTDAAPATPWLDVINSHELGYLRDSMAELSIQTEHKRASAEVRTATASAAMAHVDPASTIREHGGSCASLQIVDAHTSATAPA